MRRAARTGPTGAFRLAVPARAHCRRLLDPFLALAVAAAASEELLVGTGVCLAAQHDPIVLAKQVATLDLLSGGRVLLGVGAGWNVAEAANHGVSAGTRWAGMREHVLAMKTIWAADEAEFHGDFVGFDPLWQWPKPVASPHPPILVAGTGTRARHVACSGCPRWPATRCCRRWTTPEGSPCIRSDPGNPVARQLVSGSVARRRRTTAPHASKISAAFRNAARPVRRSPAAR